MPELITIAGGRLTARDVAAVAVGGAEVRLADGAWARLARGVERLRKVEAALGPVPLWKIADLRDEQGTPTAADLTTLARRVLVDHAAAVGPPAPTPLVRAAMLVRADALAQGYSGVRPEVVETLLAMLNQRLHPLVPALGHFSVAGDVGPLAHLALVLCAKKDEPSGRAVLGDHESGAPILDGVAAMARFGLTPIVPNLKEAFSLVVGASFAAGHAALLAVEAARLWDLAVAAAALTCEAILANTSAFEPALLGLGPGRERIVEVGALLHGWTAGSQLAEARGRVNAFSIRCIPQVLGAIAGTLDRVAGVVAEELGLVSDNPVLVDGPDGPRCLDGGNFHGERLALALDNLRLAMAEVGALAERHAFLLTNGSRNAGLPSFLIRQRGLNSGFMLAQYTAAALVSENKLLAGPFVTDSIPSCQDYEDHAGLSTHSARATDKLLVNVRRILAIELLLGAQAIDLRREEGKTPGTRGAALHAALRCAAPVWREDTALYRRIEAVDALCLPGGAVDQLIRATKEEMDV